MDGTGELLSRFCRALDPGIGTAVVAYPADRYIGYAGLEAIVRAALPRDRPFVLLAESFSGPIAISIAASPPAGLRGVILVCSFARAPYPLPPPLHSLVNFLPVRGMPAKVLAWPGFGRFATRSLRVQLANVLARVLPAVLRRRLRAVLEVDVTPLLSRIGVPVLHLSASEDRLVPGRAAAAFSVVPQIRFAGIEGPHFLLQASPSAAAAAVEAFLRDLGEVVP
jgi:pimeloyl-ACP methyl ester carboxylesterase